jgi:Domain of unknown function (DUF4184)
MPFTAAHPMAVLPLVRWRHRLGLDPTCLVIGSMVPDFEYFVRAEQLSTISHTFRGLWLWDLPATLILGVLVHLVVKWPMLLVVPAAIAGRVTRAIAAPWRARWGVAAALSCLVSAALGSATHLAWDSLTHAKGWGPRHVHALTTPIRIPLAGTMVVHRVLQHASTVVGLVVLTVVIVRWFKRRAAVDVPAYPRGAARWCVAACISASAALTTARLVVMHRTDLGNMLVGVLAGVLAGTLLASVLLVRPARQLQRAIARSVEPESRSDAPN